MARRARFVRIDEDAISRWAERVDPASLHPVDYPEETHFNGSVEEAAGWVLLLDCLNFCFWTTDGTPWQVSYAGKTWGRYLALRAALHRAVARDRAWLAPVRWANLTRGEALDLFAGEGVIPLLEDRVTILRETGRVVMERFGGTPVALAEEVAYDAPRIAALLADHFPSFRDIPRHHGEEVPVLKRAQIFAADLATTWASLGGPPIHRLASLTAFADYRIPQVLRHLGIARLSEAFEERIERGEPIDAQSDEEVELRACSIDAVERMHAALLAVRGLDVPAWILDESLWQRSHDSDVRVRHHRTVTCYY